MSRKQASVKRNFIMNAILSMSGFLFPLLTVPYVSRILLPAGTGKVAFATNVVGYFAMFAMLGIPNYGIRACAKVRDDKKELSRTVWEIFFINLIMTIIVSVVFFLALALVPRLREERILMLIISATLIFNLLGIEWMYKALERYTYISIRSILFKFAALVLMFLLVHQETDYVIYGAITVFAAGGSSILNFLNLRRHVYFHFKRKPGKKSSGLGPFRLKQHFKPIAVFFGTSVAVSVYTSLDMVMLGFMRDNTQVGYYNAAVKIKNIVTSVVTSVGAVMLPRVSYYVEKGRKEEFHRLTIKAFNFVMLMALPVSVFFIFLARYSILFLSGESFLGSVLPMQIIMPSIVLIGATNIMGIQILVPMNREKMVLYSGIAGAIVNLILNVIFIPRYGAVGAAVGTVVAELAVLAVQSWALREMLGLLVRGVRGLNLVLASGLGLFAMLITLRIPYTNNFLALLLNAMVFFGVYGMVLLLRKEPLALQMLEDVKRMMRKGV